MSHKGERLAAIAAEAFGAPTDENNSRLQVQVLFLANRDRAGVKLDHVDLGVKDRALRGDDEEQTLKVYKGAKVLEGASLWIPSKAFLAPPPAYRDVALIRSQPFVTTQERSGQGLLQTASTAAVMA